MTLIATDGRNIAVTSTNDASYSRLENATGLAVSVSTEQAQATHTVANGVQGQNDITFVTDVADAQDGTTLTVQGVIFELNSTGGVTSGNVAVNFASNATATAQTAAFNTAFDAQVASSNIRDVVGTDAGADFQILSDKATASTTHTDATTTLSSTYSTAGDGISFGDTLQVGGVTYEFAQNSISTITSGNVRVILGISDATTAAALETALDGQYTAGNTNVQASVAGAVVTLTSDLLGSTGDATVDATYSGAAAGDLAEDLAGGTGTAADGTGTSFTTVGILDLFSSSQFIISGNGVAKAGLANATVALNATNSIDVSNVAGANAAISITDGALSQLTSIRGDLGAVQNRFESTVSNLTATSENLSAARSRIRDTDFAAETANLTRNQILQQAGVAMLSQANSLPQLVLSLLQ